MNESVEVQNAAACTSMIQKKLEGMTEMTSNEHFRIQYKDWFQESEMHKCIKFMYGG